MELTYPRAQWIARLCLAFAGAEQRRADQIVFSAITVSDPHNRDEPADYIQMLASLDDTLDPAIAKIMANRLIAYSQNPGGRHKSLILNSDVSTLKRTSHPQGILAAMVPFTREQWYSMRLQGFSNILSLAGADPYESAYRWAKTVTFMALQRRHSFDLNRAIQRPALAVNLPNWTLVWRNAAQELYPYEAYVDLVLAQTHVLSLQEMPAPSRFNRSQISQVYNKRVRAHGYCLEARRRQLLSVWPHRKLPYELK